MKKKKNKIFFISVLLFFIFQLIALGHVSAKKGQTNISKIVYGQTYTYDSKKDYSLYPSYIKFLDQNHYVALVEYNVKDDYDGLINLRYISGEYSKKNNKILLGKNITKTQIIYPSFTEYKNKENFLIKTENPEKNSKQLPFQDNYIQIRKGSYQYHWRTGSADKPPRYSTGFVKLTKTNKKIPSNSQDFIKKYTAK